MSGVCRLESLSNLLEQQLLREGVDAFGVCSFFHLIFFFLNAFTFLWGFVFKAHTTTRPHNNNY